MRYFLLSTLGDADDRRLCILDSPPAGIGMKSYCMTLGERIGGDYPDEAGMKMGPDYPGIKLSSLVGNTLSYLICHRDMKDAIMEICGVADMEYLPLHIFNHKGRLHSSDYFIVSPIGAVDCLDEPASGVQLDDAMEVIQIERFALDAAKLRAAPELFRISRDPTEYVVGHRLAQALQERRFTNVKLKELPVAGGRPA